MTITAKVEHVGSLLRPGYLLDARAAYASDGLPTGGLKAAEDRAVRAALALQD